MMRPVKGSRSTGSPTQYAKLRSGSSLRDSLQSSPTDSSAGSEEPHALPLLDAPASRRPPPTSEENHQESSPGQGHGEIEGQDFLSYLCRPAQQHKDGEDQD